MSVSVAEGAHEARAICVLLGHTDEARTWNRKCPDRCCAVCAEAPLTWPGRGIRAGSEPHRLTSPQETLCAPRMAGIAVGTRCRLRVGWRHAGDTVFDARQGLRGDWRLTWARPAFYTSVFCCWR